MLYLAPLMLTVSFYFIYVLFNYYVAMLNYNSIVMIVRKMYATWVGFEIQQQPDGHVSMKGNPERLRSERSQKQPNLSGSSVRQCECQDYLIEKDK